MHKIWSLIYHRVVWTIGAAWLAGVAAQAMLGVVLKALGLLHGASLHTWLLDVGHNMGPLGAAGGLGAAAAAAAAASDPPPPKDKDPDPCASQAEDLLKASSQREKFENQIDALDKQINAIPGSIKTLADDAAKLVTGAKVEVFEQGFITLMTKLAEGMMIAMGASGFLPGLLGGGAEAVETAATTIDSVTNPISQVPGLGTASEAAEDWGWITEMQQYFQAYQGNIDALREVASENNMPTVNQFLKLIDQVNEQFDAGQKMLNEINGPNGIQQQLDDAIQTEAEARKALKDCQDGNPDGGGSGGADSGGGGSGAADAGADD
jgi:hypothetical protein